MSSLLDLQTIEQSIRKRIRQNQCRVRCELPFQSQAGFAFSSTVGTDSSGGKSLTGKTSSASTLDTITAITIEAINGYFDNLTTIQLTADNASFDTLLVQQASIAQINGDVNFNGAIASNVNIDNGTIDGTIIGGDNPTDGTFTDLQVNSSFTILGSSGNECVTYSGATDTFKICGNLLVEGDTTTIESETVVVQDVSIRLGNTAPLGDDGKDRGIEFGYHTGTDFEMGFMGWDNSDNTFTLLLGATNNDSDIYSGDLADLKINKLLANQIEGVSGDLSFGITGDLSFNVSNNISLNSLNNITIGATDGSITFVSNDIDIPIVKEYCRISYKEFDIDGDYNVCEVLSKRDLVGGFPVWYWLTDVEASGTIIYAYDLNQHVRDISTKGLRLTGIYFWFDISGDSINSVNSTITKSTMNPLSPGVPSLSSVSVDNTTLNTNTSIGTYYTKVDVNSTNYYNSHENLTVELEINKKINSVIKFYGMQLEFDKKYF